MFIYYVYYSHHPIVSFPLNYVNMKYITVNNFSKNVLTQMTDLQILGFWCRRTKDLVPLFDPNDFMIFKQ